MNPNPFPQKSFAEGAPLNPQRSTFSLKRARSQCARPPDGGSAAPSFGWFTPQEAGAKHKRPSNQAILSPEHRERRGRFGVWPLMLLIGVARVNAATCAPPSPELVGWWTGNGNADDIVGGHPGVANGGVTFEPGMVGQAFSFDGASGFVDTQLDVQPSAMQYSTWEAWVFPARLNHSERQKILSDDNGGFDRSITIEANGSMFGIFRGGGVWQPVSATLNQWQHIAVVFSPMNIIFYKNGVRYAYNNAPSGQATSRTLGIGAGPDPGNRKFFQGKIDEVAVYNGALSAAEIQAIYAAGPSGKCRPVPAAVVYLNDFAGAIGTEWSKTQTEKTPVGGRRFLGTFGEEMVSLGLGALPPHRILVLSFDLFIIGTWDGNDGPDDWKLQVAGGPTLVDTSFSNIRRQAKRQVFPGLAGSGKHDEYTGAVEIDTLGTIAGSPLSAVYAITVAFPHTGDAVQLDFSAMLSQAKPDEYWGLDNVKLAAGGTPPEVNIVAPTNVLGYAAPATVTVEADASDADGTVSQVDFYLNGALISTVRESPYRVTLSDLPAGVYPIMARVVDDQGLYRSVATNITVNGLIGEYFNKVNFTGKTTTRMDALVDFNWQDRAVIAGFDLYHSVRWTGLIQPPYSGLYTFKTHEDDGVRLWIDGQLIIDAWYAHYGQQSGQIALEADRLYAIQLENFNSRCCGAWIRLYWSTTHLSEELVPQSRLYPVFTPLIVTQPVNTQVLAGSMATLSVMGAGPALRYQWQKNRVDVPGANGPALSFASATVGDMGDYSVVLSNTYGAVTSAVARLSVSVPPRISVEDGSFGLRSNCFGFNITGTPGQTVIVEASTNLLDWSSIATNLLGFTPFYFSDLTTTNRPHRFYRARLQ